MPMDKKMFHELTEYLRNNVGEEDCDRNFTITLKFLKDKHIENRASVIQWLHDHGAYCDCEVLSIVEQQFESK